MLLVFSDERCSLWADCRAERDTKGRIGVRL